MKTRPDELSGITRKMKTGCGNLFVTINTHDGEVFELFAKLGKAGGCAAAQCETIGRLVSHEARSGGDLRGVIKQIKGIRCHEARDDTARSCADAIAQVLEGALEKEGESD